jgi:lipid A ethanolaminephosphotransferase
MKHNPDTNKVIVGAAVFLVLFANFAFFRNVLETFSGLPWAYAHALSLAIVQFCILLILLSSICFRRTIKPVLVFLFTLSAVTAYFMDTYNVIIDRDMIVNVLATNPAESADLLTPRLLAYLLLLGVLPSAFLLRLEIRPQTTVAALRSRAMLVGGALLLTVALIFLSSGFYASFFREHKVLRYYSNPATPLHAAYGFTRMHAASAQAALQAIGEDAQIHPADIERELVILVVGETARADRFSLNGYTRDTNPQLADEDVVSFRHMSACGTSTAISVPCMFAIYGRDDFSNEKADSTENLLDVLKHAGINMLWRDNNSSSKGVADRIPTEDYRSPKTNPICDLECRDEGMLAGLQDFIDRQTSGDILIILHQMGSHGPAYFKRYPSEFRVFEPTCETSQLDSCGHAEIGNSYDNTILYTDHFLARVIALLRNNDEHFETAMLYASDHGESLGESGVYLHGLPYFVAPDAQTHVPAILWFGKNYDGADVRTMRQLRDIHFSHDHIFHTVLGMFEIDAGIYDPEKDLLNLAARTSGNAREYH